MKKLCCTLLFCVLSVMVTACGTGASTPSAVTESPTDIESSTEAVTIPETVPATEPTTTPETLTETQPDTKPGTEFESQAPSDGFDAVRASDERWLSYGLDAYLAGREAPELSAFFADISNMSYLTLYADMFLYDEAKTVPVAEAFFRFVVETYGKDALTDSENRVAYKSAYLASLGVEGGYLQDPDIEAMLSRMTVSSEKDWKYVLTLDNTTYYFNDFSQGTIGQYHSMIYYNTKGLSEMITYIEENLSDMGLHTGRHFHYYMTFDGTGISFTLPDGRMSINDTYSMLHESLHAMGLHSSTVEHIWLSEGLCNYIGKLSGFNIQYASTSLQLLKMAEAGAFDARAEAGDVTAIFYKRHYECYIAADGSVASTAEMNIILYNDIWAMLERSVTGEFFHTIGDGYQQLGGTELDATGMDMSYAEATSMVAYLMDTYGMDAVLTAYRTQDVEGALGKTYEELKALWLASLPAPA